MLKKTILLGLTAVLMTACGTNDSGGASSSRGSGECVDMPSPEVAVGLTKRQRMSNYSGEKVTNSIIDSNILESFTDTSSKVINYDDNENITATIEAEHSISNGYIKVTKLKINSSSYSNYEIIMKPYNKDSFKIGRNCKGDISESEFTSYTKTDGQKEVEQKNHFKYTIEDVNVEKTITAGTFNTVKLLTNNIIDSNSYIYDWIDIDTGIPVLTEVYNADGELIQKIEALDIY